MSGEVDLSRSPLELTPIAGHVAGRFRVGEPADFDANPVTWHVLARYDVAVRGPQRDRVQVHLDDGQLRSWTLGNLNGYWRHWAARAREHPAAIRRVLPRRFAAGGVLGAPRLTTRSRPARSRARRPPRTTPWRPSIPAGIP